MTVKRIVDLKGRHAPTVALDAKISDVIDQLEAEDSGALVVSTDGNSIDGIITERDVVRGLQRFGTEVLSHAVADLMTKEVVTCTINDPVAGVMAMMDEWKIRHIPIVENGHLSGIVSIRDIIRLRLDEVQTDAAAVRDYIARS